MYKEKYLKYKNKYLSLKKQLGGAWDNLPFPVLEEKDFVCPICMEDIEEDINNPNVARCGNYHLFHKSCSDRWCRDKRNCTCPICKTSPFPITNNDSIQEISNNDGIYIDYNNIVRNSQYDPTPYLNIHEDSTDNDRYYDLYMIFNNVRNLNGRFFELINSTHPLKRINLSYSKIENLSRGSFQNLPFLKLIYLQNNRIQNIDSQAFQNMPALMEIYLQNNRIQNISDDAFQNLHGLRGIELDNNKIQNISEGVFQNLPAIEQINLSNNQIQNIHEGAFKNLLALENLILNNNQIQNIDPRTFQNLPKLSYINLEGNPIQNINELKSMYPKITFKN